jgi:hypothetical protein
MELSGSENAVGLGGGVVDAVLASGAVVRVRVSEAAGGLENVGRFTPGDLEEAFAAIGDVAAALERKLAAIAPRRASVEFGVSLSVRSGRLAALVFDGKGEASLTVRLEWEHEAAPGTPAVDGD